MGKEYSFGLYIVAVIHLKYNNISGYFNKYDQERTALRMKIITLIENQGPEELVKEHGLSFFIEYNGKKYLLDSGSTPAFMENALALGVDLRAVDKAILSHAHYDHAGGFDAFLSYNTRASLYIRSGSSENCFRMTRNGEKYIGIQAGFLDKWKERIQFVEGDYCLDEGVYLIPHKKDGRKERGERAHMFLRTPGGEVTDTFEHEQSLVFVTEKGLVIFNSCSHAGIIEIVQEVKETLKGQRVYAVFGGFHLMKGSPDKLAYTKEETEALGTCLMNEHISYVYTGHCSGTLGYSILKEVMGDQIHYLHTGKTVNLC